MYGLMCTLIFGAALGASTWLLASTVNSSLGKILTALNGANSAE